MLLLHDIHFSYPNKTVLNGLSLSLDKGEVTVLIGLSGSGKTTLFKLITGHVCPSQGQVLLKEGQVTYMQQEDLLLPWRTVLKNLLLFSELGVDKPECASFLKKAKELLCYLGLKGWEEAYPHELSGGMRQRVSLARALLQDRPILLLDEPFASLDVILREQLYAFLKQWCCERKKTVLMVTHDFRDALALADKILILSEGKITASYRVSEELRTDPYHKDQLLLQIRHELAASMQQSL